VLFIAAMITTTGCYYDKEELLYSGRTAAVNCSTINAKFSADVLPIISQKCATSGCHDAAGSAGGAILVSYPQIAALASRINQRSIVDKTMPTAGPLTTAEMAILKCWIDAGAPQN
jgi:uncharacterized membrane protein